MMNVWVVDDDQEMTNAMRLMLELLDCKVTGFLNARSAAQALLSGKRPDMMMLDINMPEVSGLDLLEFLRRRPEWKDLPIIMLSTEAADVTVDQAISLGADAYITKPVTIEELEQAVKGALIKHKKG
jgi:CheY-like chemotaxis protein